MPGEGGDVEAFLTRPGAAPERIRAAAEAGHLHGLAAGLVLTSGAGLTTQVAGRAGTTEEAVVHMLLEPAGRRLLEGSEEPVRVSALLDRR